ncbi:sarcalumenin-like [Salvelinus alpinus]|uniref:sarcalumenin-like n=1 Tax=Salvelinus alpinus TaxID=8036 RepID=UPI0039FC385F
MKGIVSICCFFSLLVLALAEEEVEDVLSNILRDRSHIDETLRLASEENAAENYHAAIQKLRKIYHSAIKPMEQAYKYNELRAHEISGTVRALLGTLLPLQVVSVCWLDLRSVSAIMSPFHLLVDMISQTDLGSG